MNKTLIVFGILGLLLVSSVSGYYIYQERMSDVSRYEKIYDEFGDMNIERGSIIDGKKVVYYNGSLEELVNG